MPAGYVYLLASRRNGTLYTGVTNDLMRRLQQHRDGTGSEFAKQYRATRLVYFEHYESIQDAIAREKQIKGWKRAWKIDLIESVHSGWNDLVLKIEPGTV
jgi:putative endonuclease